MILDDRKLECNRQLLEAEKRKAELEQILAVKQTECVRDLGEKMYCEIINFLRSKLNVRIK